jgi:hypothetical protein
MLPHRTTAAALVLAALDAIDAAEPEGETVRVPTRDRTSLAEALNPRRASAARVKRSRRVVDDEDVLTGPEARHG